MDSTYYTKSMNFEVIIRDNSLQPGEDISPRYKLYKLNELWVRLPLVFGNRNWLSCICLQDICKRVLQLLDYDQSLIKPIFPYNFPELMLSELSKQECRKFRKYLIASNKMIGQTITAIKGLKIIKNIFQSRPLSFACMFWPPDSWWTLRFPQSGCSPSGAILFKLILWYTHWDVFLSPSVKIT